MPFRILNTASLCLAISATIALADNHSELNTPTSPTSIDQAMLFRSFVKDAPGCREAVSLQKRAAKSGMIAPNQKTPPAGVSALDTPVFSETVGAAAATCPDAFAWTQFLTAIQYHFWNWSIDQTVWPHSPLPICANAGDKNCCPADVLSNPGSAPNEQCPFNRASFDPVPALPLTPNGAPSGVMISHRGAHKKTYVEQLDPGRALRDIEVELVFRNPSMVDYLFRNDMYSQQGLGSRTKAANAAVARGDIGAAQALEVRLRAGAVMVKADFLHQDVMKAQGLIQGEAYGVPNNPDYPYLTVEFTGKPIKLADGGTYDPSGIYYMLAMTNASKDLPNWHWYAMEHVANRGRCDYIGCNDSFGYLVDPEMANGAKYGGTFIPPLQGLQNNQTQEASSSTNPNDPIFVTGTFYDPKTYDEQISKELAMLFHGMGIATDDADLDPKVISPTDPQWLNYRLKGTQTDFTTSHGVPQGTGATITEGGFVNSASCMTCHSQATFTEEGGPGVGGSVGATWRLNLFGFGQVAMGSPELTWFFSPGNAATAYKSIQSDFIWGILGAQPIKDGDGNATVPAHPTILK